MKTIQLNLLSVGMTLFLMNGYAQEANIEWVEVASEKVIVHYSLLDEKADANRQYLVNLYTSKDNYSGPLAKVTGDVGTEVKAGADNRIVWDITKEYPAFKGDLTLEVRGRVFVPFVKLTSIDAGTVFKRGKNYPITWTSGNLNGKVNIELYSGNDRVWGENNQDNVGKYDWFVPGSVKKSSSYYLKFTNAKDRGDFITSPLFTIKPKVGLFPKLLGIGVIGGAAALLGGGGGENGGNSPQTEKGLGRWPGTPD